MNVPSSPEVIAEEFEVALAANGVPRCDLVHDFVRTIAEAIAEVEQEWFALMEDT